MLTPVRFLRRSIWLILAWMSWVVAIGGVSAAQDRCSPSDGRNGVHTLAYLVGGPQIACAFSCTFCAFCRRHPIHIVQPWAVHTLAHLIIGPQIACAPVFELTFLPVRLRMNTVNLIRHSSA